VSVDALYEIERLRQEATDLRARLAVALRERDELERLAFEANEREKVAEQRVERLRVALADGVELAEEGWSYASDYFREKWGARSGLDALCSALADDAREDSGSTADDGKGA